MNNVAAEMEHLHKLAKGNPSKRFTRLWGLITNPLWLAHAWEQIRRNRGAQTPGVNRLTAEDVDMVSVMKLAERLKTGHYRPLPVKRVYIPKARSKTKTRPLGIPSIEDRIVQQALRMALEPIFEADFLSCSHGFRQGRSTHTALRDVVRTYPSASYIIEGDIEGFYDNISHAKLMTCIQERIADGKILGLIRKFLNAGYLEEWTFHRSFSGVPQGGIVSPLMSNVFAHQLDKFMIEDSGANRVQTREQQRRRSNPEYRRIDSRIQYLRRKRERTGDASLTETIVELEKRRAKEPCFLKDRKHPGKLKYYRYADDFVILVYGTKQEALDIKRKVAEKLLGMNLRLSEEKTKVTHWDEPVRFLGYEIRGIPKRHGVGIWARLSIPQDRFARILAAIRENCGFHQIPEADLMQQVGAQFRGWCNYYRYATSPQGTFSRLASETWWAYAHYLARKHRCSIRKLLQSKTRAGGYEVVAAKGRRRKTFRLRIGDRDLFLDILAPKTASIHQVSCHQNWTVDLMPLKPTNWQSGRSLATRLAALDRANGVCERCHEKPVATVHHTATLRRKRSLIARVKSDQSQHTTAIALCETCHLQTHQGNYGPRKPR
jgi:RNA-directed DNA polymerase